MPSHTFTKHERLKSQILIGELFKRGHSFNKYPIRVIWLPLEQYSPSTLQIAFSVPKRRFKKAVQRNRIRRQIKEAFRLQKHKLIHHLESINLPPIVLMFIYVGKEALPYSDIEKAIYKSINRLVENTAKQSPQTK